MDRRPGQLSTSGQPKSRAGGQSVFDRRFGGGQTTPTRCTTCGCELELSADPDDEDLYWIVEV